MELNWGYDSLTFRFYNFTFSNSFLSVSELQFQFGQLKYEVNYIIASRLFWKEEL